MRKVRRWAVSALIALSTATAALIPAAAPANAIVGGTPGNVAYFAQVATTGSDPGVYSCGGTAIGGDWVLTAAHCITVPGRRSVAVRLGAAGSWIDAVQIVTHPLYDGNVSHGHDLALLQLPTGTVRGVIIPRVGAPWDPGAYAPGTPAEIMGVGDTCAHCPPSSGLLTANTTLVGDDDMNEIFNPWPFQEDISDAWLDWLVIGAGSMERTICAGDSGGPLVVHRNGLATLIGVVSYDYASVTDDGCDNPAAFAELSGQQLAWVANQVPVVAANWGTCIAADGNAGTTYVHYSTTAYAGDQGDGPYHWQITCRIIGVTVPNLLGWDEASARTAITGSGLNVGTVSHHNDCVSPGDVETQNPSGGVEVARNTSVSITVSTCSSPGGGSGGGPGGGPGGGGGHPPILPK